jgi:catechol 2,3-dioxygenase-like lactoylglutathione lyase family enzyme
VRRLIPLLSLAALSLLTSAQGQIYTANATGVSLGQWHTLVRDVETTKNFWMQLGGTPIKIDGTDVIKFHGVLIFLSPGSPTAGSRGSTVNHVGLGSQNVQQLFAKLQAEGVKVDPATLRKSPLNGQYLFDVNSPDGLMIEVTEEAGVDPYPKLPPDVPIESNHMHLFVAQPARKDMQSWYVQTFGGEPSERRGEYIVGLPGVKFFRIAPCGSEYSACPEAGPAPTKGRALDHIGFEVKNLRAFCKKLEANGVKFDEPFSKSRHKSFTSAELTDPWGTSIELTEGLNRF